MAAVETDLRSSAPAAGRLEPVLEPTDVAPAEALRIEVGGLAVAVESEDAEWRALARERYGAFATRRAPAARLVYRVTGERSPSPRWLFEARQQPLSLDARGRLHGAAFRARFLDPGRRLEAAGPLATYPTDHLLRALWSRLAGRGLIVHAAALASGDRGWLCAGPSGSGKSTLAGLFPEHALADEFAAVRIGEAVSVAGLPFWAGRPGAARLESIYLLRHGRQNRRRRLTVSEALAGLRAQVSWPSWDRRALAGAFDALGDLVTRVPAWELRFRPETSVWSVLSAPVEETR